MFKRGVKKVLLSIFTIIFITVSFLAVIVRPVQAQIPVSDASATALQVQQIAKKSIGASILQSGTIAVISVMNNFIQKVAYDAAVWVATGNKGQKSLFDGRNSLDYLRDSALTGSRDFVRDVLKDATNGYLNVDLCSPKFPSIILKLKLGLLGQSNLTPPDCTWNKLSSNWTQFIGAFESGEVLKHVGVMFDTKQSELGVALEINGRLLAKTDEINTAAMIDRITNGGWKGVSSIVTGRVVTPADVVKSSFGNDVLGGPGRALEGSTQSYLNALGAGAWQIIPTAVATFTNTLLSKTLDRIQKGIFLSDFFGDDADILDPTQISSLSIGRRRAQEVYSDLIKPKIVTSNNYDPLTNFASCPIKDAQADNCILDDGFAVAIRSANHSAPISIKEAIKQGYLDGGKPLIASTDPRNEQKNCYLQGYCFSNLVKLRKERILPVGFELAANLSSNEKPFTLKEIVDNFNNCTIGGERDSAHPFCHLIDPNWILKVPKAVCDAQVYGSTLISSEGSIRSEVCVDQKSCISEDGNGNCVGGYGYCTKEKNIWRVASDSCDEQFNTCLTYTGRDKTKNSYLKNTVNFGVCSADNVGCRAYSVNQDFASNWTFNAGDVINFNKNLSICEAESAGCTELYTKDNGLAYNLLPNSSFEDLVSGVPAGWFTNLLNISSDKSQSYDGSVAIKLQGVTGLYLDTPIKLAPNTAYSVSAYLNRVSVASISASLSIYLYTNNLAKGGSTINNLGYYNPANLITSCDLKTANGQSYLSRPVVVEDGYKRESCSFLTPNTNLYAKLVITGTAYIDAVQLEEGSEASASYLSSGYGVISSTNMKIAPDYLDCSIGSTDSRCVNYAPVCREEEVGCQLYTPGNGDPNIPGMITVDDVCPQECVGYDTYKPERTQFEDPNKVLAFNYFIPTTAKICSAVSVGCSEFTNLDTESTDYFTSLRQCIKPDPAKESTFYTWEGSESAGYQLMNHKLKTGPSLPLAGDTGSGPFPDYVVGTIASGCTKAIYNLPITSPNYNIDCRELYNVNGQVSYRLLSKTIISNNECAQYRKTTGNKVDCDNSGGIWNGTANQCIYLGYKPGSASCSAQVNGCRAYSGPSASNLRLVLQNDFELGNTEKWQGGIISSESISAGGHSLRTLLINPNLDLTKIDLPVEPKQTYVLSFWAKTNQPGTMTISMIGATTEQYKADIKGDWRYFEVGPFNTGSVIDPNVILRLSLPGGFWLDNVILKEAREKLYLIENSWNTPTSCDQVFNGDFLPQAMLGCKAYNNKDGNELYLKSFSSLCREEAAGCKAFVNTYNNANDKAQTYDYVNVPADKTVYLVDDGTKTCQAKDIGCRAIGQPELYKEANANTVFYKNLPDQYSSSLCKTEEIGCESWTSNKGIDYFKVPTGLCEFKAPSAGAIGGWFKKGTSEACYPGVLKNGLNAIWRNADDPYDNLVGVCPEVQNGCAEFIDPLDTATTGVGKVATEKAYYLIDNQKLTDLEKECSDGASREEGCLLFDRTDNLNKLWSAEGTYFKASKDGGIIPPVSYVGYCMAKDTSTVPASIVPSSILCIEKGDCPTSGTAVPGVSTLTYTGNCAFFNNQNNTNVILKVARDRQCAEWLTCKSSYSAYDPISGQARTVCAELGLCNEYQVTGGNTSLCSNFIINNSDSKKLLNADNYSARPVDWSSYDYSGYSLGGKYPITDIHFFDTDPSSEMEWKMGVDLREDSSVSGAIFDFKTLDGKLLIDVEGEPSTCRGYPEQDSPFPENLKHYDSNGQLVTVDNGFQSANICNNSEDCECSYSKLTYANASSKQYVTYGNRSIPAGICQGGPRDGLACKPGIKFEEDPNNACADPIEGGTCLRLQRQDDVLGFEGYCLEYDLSTSLNGNPDEKACITWLPQDIVKGGKDIYNQFRTAGYVPSIGGGKYYCLQAEGRREPVGAVFNGKRIADNDGAQYDNLLRLTPEGASACLQNIKFCGTNETSFPLNGVGNNFSIGINHNIGMSGKNTFKPIGSLLNLNKDEIDLMKITLLNGESFDIGSVFYIRSNQPNTKYFAQYTNFCDNDTTTNCKGEEGVRGLKKVDDGFQVARSVVEKDAWYFRYDNDPADEEDATIINLFELSDSELGDLCEAAHDNNYFFNLRFNFNPLTGKFESMDVASCKGSGLDVYNVYGIYFRMREVCTVVADVASNRNMADTQLLWTQTEVDVDRIHYNTEINPYGSASSDIAPDNYTNWYSYFTIGKKDFAGAPFSCKADCGVPLPTDSDNETIDFDPNDSSIFTRNNLIQIGIDRLSKIFARVFKIFNLNNDRIGYDIINCETKSDPGCYNITKNLSFNSKKPAIYSFLRSKQLTNGQYQLLKEGQLVVNDKTQGDISVKSNQLQTSVRFYFWADTSHMPITSINVDWGDGSVIETQDGKYKNHKPRCASGDEGKFCRNNINISCQEDLDCFVQDLNPSVIPTCTLDSHCNDVTFGTAIPTCKNNYCANPKTGMSLLNACSNSGKVFGNTPEACDEAYFELQHVYTCNLDDPYYVSGKCVFSPKVIIKDNWEIESATATYNGQIILTP